MKKRQLLILGIITAITAILFMFPVTGHALIDMGTIDDTNIQWVIEDNGTLTVSGSGTIPDCGVSHWSDYASNVTALEVSGTITGIGERAFENLTSLKTATICDTVTSIGKQAFMLCSALESLQLPASLTTMGTEVLVADEKLTSVTLSATNTNFKVEDGMLTDAAETTIYWAGGITKSTYYIPNTYTTIDATVFAASTALTSVYVPDTVTTIGRLAFYGVDNVYGVAGSTLEAYAEGNDITLAGTFDGMCGTTVYYKKTKEVFKDSASIITTMTITGEGNMTDYHTTAPAPWTDALASLNIVKINDGVTSVGSQSFNDATALTSVTLPSSVTSIGMSAFDGCTSLTGITLPAALKKIDQGAFADTGLTTITIPATVNSMNINAFNGCASLESIIVASANTSYTAEDGVVFSKGKDSLCIYPEGKTDETYAVPSAVGQIYGGFRGSSALKYVYIPKSVTAIYANVFTVCEGLTVYGYTGTRAQTYAEEQEITFVPMDGTVDNSDITWYYDYITQKLTVSGEGTVPAVDNDELWRVFTDKTKTISIGEGITALSTSSFGQYSALEALYFPSTLSEIKNSAFYTTHTLSITITYEGSRDEYDDITIGVNNHGIVRATVVCTQTVSITGIATGTNTVFVQTNNMNDGRRVAVATYSSDGKMLSFDYVTITNNMGSLSVYGNGDTIKAFYMNTSSLRPYCDVKTETVS